MPIVTIQQSLRDLEQKRRLVAGITQAFFHAYGVRPEQVQVFIHEVDHENWAKAGKLAVDADVRSTGPARRSGALSSIGAFHGARNFDVRGHIELAEDRNALFRPRECGSSNPPPGGSLTLTSR
jgi:4-oxalocrotonate tautomerase family enzyme